MRDITWNNSIWHLNSLQFVNYSLIFHSLAVAQRVQPGQRLCWADSDGGPQQASHSRPGPQASLDHQHGGVLLYEEPTALYISEPPEESVVTLPQHQVGPVHALQPLHQIQQSQAGAREGAAWAEPSVSAAVQWLKREARLKPTVAEHLLSKEN